MTVVLRLLPRVADGPIIGTTRRGTGVGGQEPRVGVEQVRSLITAHARAEGDEVSGLPGVLVKKVTDPTEPTPSIAEPILAFSFQGSKRIALGERVYDQTAGTFMVVAVDLPITGHYADASRSEPYLGVALELRPAAIAELLVGEAAGLRGIHTPPPPGISIHRASPEIVEALARLLALADHPEDAPVLAPLVERELLWRVLSGPAGPTVRQIGLADSSLSYIGRAVRHLRSNAFEPIQVEELAALSGMAVSSFHKHFRAVTSMSPIQYQKRLRLQVARLRLFHDPTDIAAVGHSVGYTSASQFSREYRREFGVPPSADATRMRQAEQATA
ncbi:AraC family transcriptional regulator [Nocardioides endophyticus]|uniref:AraC family transcriptional regulator n=1 Tax=Nocardioides endophyticus TaxID=1353775 RepID=A0ABP8YRN1_9ACTN